MSLLHRKQKGQHHRHLHAMGQPDEERLHGYWASVLPQPQIGEKGVCLGAPKPHRQPTEQDARRKIPRFAGREGGDYEEAEAH